MALTKNTPIPILEGKLQTYPLYRAIHAREGAMIFKRSDGYASNAAGGNVFLGHAYSEADNSLGNDGDLEVFVRNGRYLAKVAVGSLAITDVGSPVYASDDGTLTLTATGNSRVGRVVKYESAGVGLVEFQPLTEVDGTAGAHIADAATVSDPPTQAEVNALVSKFNTLLAQLEAFGALLTA